MFDATDFGQVHFGGADLGDRRRTCRLVDLANRIARHPEGTLPHKLQDPAAYQAMYRLCKQPAVTHAAVLEPHRQLALTRLREHRGVALLLHDTTELDYTSKRSLQGLGQIGGGFGRGYQCHHSLAIDPATKQVLGLVSQILHRRPHVPDDEGRAARRARADRESRLWVAGAAASGPLPAECHGVDVCDRGADSFEFLDFEHAHGRHYVLRSKHDRRAWTGHRGAGRQVRLHAYARQLRSRGRRRVQVSGQPGQPRRTTTVRVGFAAVRLRAPDWASGEHRGGPLPVWVVRAWEADPPPGVNEPLEWLLLTNEPVRTLADAQRVLGYYECRPLVEEFHKAQKTGCGVQLPQFTQADRLEPMIALLSVVAVQLLNLRAACRGPAADTTPAATLVPALAVVVLSRWRLGESRPDWSVRDFLYALARLGGHQNRSVDGPPGWLTLSRGWSKLAERLAFAEEIGFDRSD